MILIQRNEKIFPGGSMFEKERSYFELDKSELAILETPQEIIDILDNEGYYCPDYRQALVYKKEDKLKNKPIKLLKVLSKSLKDDKEQFDNLKKKVDERLGTSRKEQTECLICITHNPYDVAGMSTNRNWSSCMELDYGSYRDTPLKQVQYGGMCAYLIEKDDKQINQPIARIAIKRLVGDNDSFVFLNENKIYGDKQFAKELGFEKKVHELLKESNKETTKGVKSFIRKDDNSYSDADLNSYFDMENLDFDKMSKEEIDKLSESDGLTLDFVLENGDKLNLLVFFAEHSNWNENDLLKVYEAFKDKIDSTKLFNYCANLVGPLVKQELWKNINYSKITDHLDELDYKIADAHANEINFTKIVSENKFGNRTFIDYILEEHYEKIDWEYYSRHYNSLNDEILRKFPRILNWDSINKRFVELYNKSKNLQTQFIFFYPLHVDIDYITKHISFRKSNENEREGDICYFIDYCNSSIQKQIAEGLLKNNMEIKNNKTAIYIIKKRYLSK